MPRKRTPNDNAQERMRFFSVLIPPKNGAKMTRYPWVASDAWPKTASLQVTLGETSKFECYVRPLRGLDAFPYADKNLALPVVVVSKGNYEEPDFILRLEESALSVWKQIEACGGIEVDAHDWQRVPGMIDGSRKCSRCNVIAKIGKPDAICCECQKPTAHFIKNGFWFCKEHEPKITSLF